MSTETTPEIINTTEKKSGSSLALAAIVISIGAIIFSTHNFYMMMHAKIKSQKNMVSLNQSVQSEISTLQNNHDMQLQKTLADVTYLVRLANLQLTVGHDEQTALTTLATAQEQLANMQNESLNPLKMALSADIATLRATPVPDTKKLFIDIEMVQQEIQNLSAIPKKPDVSLQKTIDAVKSADQHEPWYRRIAGGLAQLKTLFVIRHLDKTNTPLFSPELESTVKQNITMQLNMAQWALLHHNQTIYESTLQNVSQWLQIYFGLSTAQNPVIAQLSALQKMQIDTVLPTLNNTLAALSAVKTDIKPDIKAKTTSPASSTSASTPTVTPTLNAPEKATSSGVET